MQVVPTFTGTTDVATMKPRLPFWSALERHVMRKGPVRPFRLSRHGIQAVYSRTNCGVDCATEFRSDMNSSSTTPGWEQKLLTFFFNMLLVNSYNAWLLLSNENHLKSTGALGSVDKFRNRVNKTSSFADYSIDIAEQLLEYTAS